MHKIILALIINAIYFNIAFAEQVTPSQLLAGYTANREGIKTHITKSEELSSSIDTAYGDNPKWMRQIFEFRTDGKRVDVNMSKWFNLDEPEAAGLREYSSRKRVIWDEDRWIEHNFGTLLGSRDMVYISSKEQRKDSFVSKAYGGSVLDGIFIGDQQPIEAILGQVNDITIRSEMEKVNGFSCYVIDASTPNGKYSLWMDPEHGYNIAKAKVHKGPDDILYGKPINQHSKPQSPQPEKGKTFTKPTGAPERIMPGKREEFFFSLDNVNFQKIGDSWVPIEADYEHTTKYTDGRLITGKKHHKRTHIDASPDFEAVSAFVPDIPDGTMVYIEGVDGITYSWQNGKPLANIEDIIIEQIHNMAQEVTSEIDAESAKTTEKKSNIAYSESNTGTNIKSIITSPRPAETSEASSHHVPIFILTVCLIVGIISWQVFSRFMRKKVC